jgi:hypothetical protein
MHIVIFMNIVFGLGFLCLASEYIFLNHQNIYNVVLCYNYIQFWKYQVL